MDDISTTRSRQAAAGASLTTALKVHARLYLCAPGGGLKPSRFVLFQVSGAIGMAMFFMAWSEISYILRGVRHGATVSWCVAYATSVLWQHLLHRTIVFGSTQPYWASLGKVLLVYFTSLVLSAVLNGLLIEVLHLNATLGFAITTVFVGVLNYVAMVRYGFSDEDVDGLNDDDSADERENPKDVVVLSFDPIVDLSLAEIKAIGDRFSGAMGNKKKQWGGEHHA